MHFAQDKPMGYPGVELEIQQSVLKLNDENSEPSKGAASIVRPGRALVIHPLSSAQ